MCEQCERNLEKIAQYIGRIPGLIEQQAIQQKSDRYEHSEPMAAGGPAGKYRLTSPYSNMPGVQWKADMANAGAAIATIAVSSDQNVVVPGFLVGDTGTSELTPVKALLIAVPSGGSVPVDSEWYDLTDSNSVLYISVATTAAAYVNIIFRHKRE